MRADRTGWFAAAGVETAAAVVKAGTPGRVTTTCVKVDEPSTFTGLDWEYIFLNRQPETWRSVAVQ